MRWVVLSDIHYNVKNYKTLDLKSKLITYLKNECMQNGAFSFVIITGDSMHEYSGGHVPSVRA